MAAALKEIGIEDSIPEAPAGAFAEVPVQKESFADEVDDYLKYKKLEKQLEHYDVMEEYIKLETRNLEKELLHAQEEVQLSSLR